MDDRRKPSWAPLDLFGKGLGRLSIVSRHEMGLMREAGKVVADCHAALKSFIQPGVRTLDIDRFVEERIASHNMEAAQKGYRGYPFATCTSVNDEVCHGFPSDRVLLEGDIVTVDMVVRHKGWHADSAWSYGVGTVSEEASKLLRVTEQALWKGIEAVRIGGPLYAIGEAILPFVTDEGFSVVRDFTGHGIGMRIHELPPEVLHFPLPKYPGQNLKFRKGMALTIEPMINVGGFETKMDENGWTARTADGSLSAQYEHTIVVTDHGIEIITVL